MFIINITETSYDSLDQRFQPQFHSGPKVKTDEVVGQTQYLVKI